MNEKKAKRIRRESRYHPTDPRKYVQVKSKNTRGVTLELDPACSRSLYQELKKEES